MIGAFIEGNSWDDVPVEEFHGESRQKLAFVNFFASMSGRFDWHHKEQMDIIMANGAIPMMTMEARFWDGRLREEDSKDILRRITEGEYDEAFMKWINGYGNSWEIGFRNWIKTKPDDTRIMLRFAHEMNGEWYPWGNQPELYVEAWRYLYALFEREDINQYIEWVWCPAGTMNVGDHADLTRYYPGDQYVDWTCFDDYNWGTNFDWSEWTKFGDLIAPIYNFLVNTYPKKPIIIAEFGSSEPEDVPNPSLGQYGDNTDFQEDKDFWMKQIVNELEFKYTAIRGIALFNYGTFRIYGSTLQDNEATGLDGWNFAMRTGYFTSDFISANHTRRKISWR